MYLICDTLQLGSPQQKPKLVKLLCDVSGSMYRFNGQDGRLDRQLETILMVMEAFESYEHKIKVCQIVMWVWEVGVIYSASV